MSGLLRKVLARLGYQPIPAAAAAGSAERPIGSISSFLADIRGRGFQPRGILDVGANEGYWIRMALRIFPDTPCILIEPQDEMVPLLTKVTRDFAGVELFKAGAAAEAGRLVLTIWEDLAGSSYLPRVDDRKLQDGTQRWTDMVTLDDLLHERQTFHPDLVKLDIQGYELEALKGGESLFGRTQVFIAETSLFSSSPQEPTTREVVDFMADRGYELYDVTEYLRRPADGALGQIDLAFAKADGLLRKHKSWTA